jgi:hypothetical protein
LCSVRAKDDVVVDRHLEDLPGGDKRVCHSPVIRGRRRVTARVIVREQGRRGAERNRNILRSELADEFSLKTHTLLITVCQARLGDALV